MGPPWPISWLQKDVQSLPSLVHFSCDTLALETSSWIQPSSASRKQLFFKWCSILVWGLWQIKQWTSLGGFLHTSKTHLGSFSITWLNTPYATMTFTVLICQHVHVVFSVILSTVVSVISSWFVCNYGQQDNFESRRCTNIKIWSAQIEKHWFVCVCVCVCVCVGEREREREDGGREREREERRERGVRGERRRRERERERESNIYHIFKCSDE